MRKIKFPENEGGHSTLADLMQPTDKQWDENMLHQYMSHEDADDYISHNIVVRIN